MNLGIIIGLPAIVAPLVTGPASAHEAPSGWEYPTSCCSNNDCREIAADDVRPHAGGWRVIATGELIPYEQAKTSPDGKFHRCSYAFLGSSEQDITICLFAPQMGH